MRTVKVEDLQRGDVIREGGRRIVVSIVERLPERCPFHIHVNESLCWDAGTLVTVEN